MERPFSGDWGNEQVPSLAHPLLDEVLELSGLAVLWWAWRRFHLGEPEQRRRLWREGTLREPMSE